MSIQETLAWQPGTTAETPLPPQVDPNDLAGGEDPFLRHYQKLGPVFRVPRHNKMLTVLAGPEINVFMARYDPARMELSTRDRVALAAYTEIKEGRGSRNGGVWLDVSHLGAEMVERSFRGMVRRCRDFGLDSGSRARSCCRIDCSRAHQAATASAEGSLIGT